MGQGRNKLDWPRTWLGVTGYDGPMQLIVQGYRPELKRYRYIWGFYVRGFKPWEHCQPCFRGTRAEGIDPLMSDGSVPLPRPTDYFYLHGNAAGGKEARREFNLHLAVRPKEGETAQVVTNDGAVFTLENAEQIVIRGPLEELAGSADHAMYCKCPNFRFGMQMYPTPLELTGPKAPRLPRLR